MINKIVHVETIKNIKQIVGYIYFDMGRETETEREREREASGYTYQFPAVRITQLYVHTLYIQPVTPAYICELICDHVRPLELKKC